MIAFNIIFLIIILVGVAKFVPWLYFVYAVGLIAWWQYYQQSKLDQKIKEKRKQLGYD
jgi:hypothetical protein